MYPTFFQGETAAGAEGGSGAAAPGNSGSGIKLRNLSSLLSTSGQGSGGAAGQHSCSCSRHSRHSAAAAAAPTTAAAAAERYLYDQPPVAHSHSGRSCPGKVPSLFLLHNLKPIIHTPHIFTGKTYSALTTQHNCDNLAQIQQSTYYR